MIYTEMTKRALDISFNAHKNKTDKSGAPYVYHPFHVAEQMKTEDEVIVALLHDVVEDTDMTFEDLRAEGFSEEVLSALKLLTHDKSEPYMDYVARIKGNPLATAVKLADLRHNSDLTRLNVVDDKALARVKKYAEAIKLLEKEVEGLPAKYFENPEILILGSFPGSSSLEAREYYFDKKNRIWSVLAKIYGENIPENQEQKNELLRKHHIAFWDVYHSVAATGSKDSRIRGSDCDYNLIGRFLAEHGTIKRVLVAGEKAQTAFEKLYEEQKQEFAKVSVDVRSVSSTSNANSRWFDEDAWRDALKEGTHDK